MKYLFLHKKKYESVGFRKVRERDNKEIPFSGKYIDYELVIRKII